MIWGLSNSSFRAEWFSTVSAQTSLNWFLLSLKRAKHVDKNRYCCFHHQDFWNKYFFFLWYDYVYRAEGHTAVDMSVTPIWKKLYLKILMRETCLGFFNIEEFYRSWTLAASGGFKKIFSPHFVHTKIFVWPSQILKVFSSTFQHHDKVV